jgi:hypothetical protein
VTSTSSTTPNPALRDEQSYSPAHFKVVCDRFGDPAALDRYDTIFVDPITVAGRLCFGWCKGQPEALSEKTGKPIAAASRLRLIAAAVRKARMKSSVTPCR